MTLLYLVLGVLVLVVCTADLLWTALWADGGAGPLSSRITSATWRALYGLAGKHSRLLSMAGPLVLMLSLALWVALLWGGWTLVFAGGESVLVDARDGGPISWAERAYFVAYTVFTLGNGDFYPRDGVWQIVTSLTTGSGMLFVTMGVSYVLSVLGAVVDKRTLASDITGIGRDSEAFLRTGWDGEDFHELDLPMNAISSDINRLAKQHKAYPILHYYHSDSRDESAPVAIARFDEALTVLRFGVPEERRPNEPIVEGARSSVHSYVQTLDGAFVHPADEPPPPPDLAWLRDAGLPVASDEDFGDALDDLSERRRKLLGAVTSDAQQWSGEDDA